MTKGGVGAGSNRTQIVDRTRSTDTDNFWQAYRLRLLDAHGSVVAESQVQEFDRAKARLQLATPLPVEPQPGQAYELTSGEEAPILAIRHFLGLKLTDRIPPVVVRLGTTRGTNALLERRGARTALVTTRGFGDILQDRLSKPPQAVRALPSANPSRSSSRWSRSTNGSDAEGQVLLPAGSGPVRAALEPLREQGIESLAICLLHAYAQSRPMNNWWSRSPASWIFERSASAATLRRW